MSIARDYGKENEWRKKSYKSYSFRAAIKDGENDRLERAMDGRPFPEWVRKHIDEDLDKQQRKPKK